MSDNPHVSVTAAEANRLTQKILVQLGALMAHTSHINHETERYVHVDDVMEALQAAILVYVDEEAVHESMTEYFAKILAEKTDARVKIKGHLFDFGGENLGQPRF